MEIFEHDNDIDTETEQIVLCEMPLNSCIKTTWRLELDENELCMKWSCDDKSIGDGINDVEEFKILGADGKHKKSFWRNVYKYCAAVDSWRVEKFVDFVDSLRVEKFYCIIRTKSIRIKNKIYVYDIIVSGINCKHGPFDLKHILKLAVDQGYQISAKYYNYDDFVCELGKENANNVRFTTFLFRKC